MGERNQRRFWIALLVLCAIGGAAAARRIAALSRAPGSGAAAFSGLDAQFGSKAGLTLLHVAPSLLFVLLLPLQFVARIRQRRPRLHRWLGRAVMSLGAIIGTSALLLSGSPVGGLVEATATTLFGCYFLVALGMAWWNIRNRRVERHREWAIRMTAVALGVATTRPVMALFFATNRWTGLTPEQFFGPAMWIGFLSTCLAGETWIKTWRTGHSDRPDSGASLASIN